MGMGCALLLVLGYIFRVDRTWSLVQRQRGMFQLC